jgi:hypothetical protein
MSIHDQWCLPTALSRFLELISISCRSATRQASYRRVSRRNDVVHSKLEAVKVMITQTRITAAARSPASPSLDEGEHTTIITGRQTH